MKKYLGLSVYLSFLSVGIQKVLFPQEFCSAIIPVFLIALVIWLLLLGQKRWWNISIVLGAHIIFLGLLIYHHFFSNAVTLNVILSQFWEGFQVLITTVENILPHKEIFYLLLSCGITIAFLWRNKITSFSYAIKTVLCFPLLIEGIYFYQTYHYEPFSNYEFNKIAQFFGYPMAWEYEIISVSAKQALFDKLEQNEQPNYADIKDIKFPDNIYLIQFESLDNNALESGAMPFLYSILPNSAVYQVQPHLKKSSANSDFQVLTLKSVYDESIGVLYKLITPDFYITHKTLPQLLKEKGYNTFFYHGNYGKFFNRRPHVEKMGFDKIYFREELTNRYLQGEWGVEDADMIDLISKQSLANKNFHFFITVSSHYDFRLGSEKTNFIPYPASLRDKYLNILYETDQSLKKLIAKAPQKSIFMIYSDHESETDEDRRTVFMIYDKQHPLARKGKIKVRDIPLMIKQIFEQSTL